jgi:uroporphyrinogen decarboxylase
MNDITRYPWPDPADPVRRRGLKERVRWIREETGCAAVLNVQSAFVHTSQYIRGFEDWFMDLAGDTRLIEALFDAVLDVSLGICRTFLEEVGRDVDVLMASDDLGLQNGLLASPELYRRIFKKRHAKYFRLLHDLSPGKVLFHSCGSIAEIMDDLIDIGVDVINPVQVTAAGMEPRNLKQRYGDRLAFWGAVDTHRVLPRGGTREVKNEVENRIDELNTDGGYILGAVHNIQPDVPLNNILTMFRHAREYSDARARRSTE